MGEVRTASIIPLIEALHREKRWLYAQVVGMVAGLEPDTSREVHYKDWQVAQALLIEVDHDGLAMLWQAAQHDTDLGYAMRQSDDYGPVRFRGVPVYEVRSLPEPHWRVVNSLRKV